MAKVKRFSVKISIPAKRRFQEEILDYLFHNFSVDRVLEVEFDILEKVKSLEINPKRGKKDELLSSRYLLDYRTILFKETRYFELKIVYYVDEQNIIVEVTDFFPTLMNPDKLSNRNK